MTIYIATVDSLEYIPKNVSFQDSVTDKVVVFYKETDTVSMVTVANLYQKNREVELIKVNDRDDMLIMLGVMLGEQSDVDGSTAKIVLLDSSIPIPSRYEGRVSTGYPENSKPAAKRKTGGRRGSGKKTGTKGDVKTEPDVKSDDKSDLSTETVDIDTDTDTNTDSESEADGSGEPVKKN